MQEFSLKHFKDAYNVVEIFDNTFDKYILNTLEMLQRKW